MFLNSSTNKEYNDVEKRIEELKKLKDTMVVDGLVYQIVEERIQYLSQK
jgi:hypothetical protein